MKLSELKPEEKRILAAEACGWRRQWNCYNNAVLYKADSEFEPHEAGTENGPLHECVWEVLPDYGNDLNACAEMEKTLTDAEFSQYAWRVLGDGRIECRAFFGATAAQRLDAFLLAKGLAE